MDRTKCVGSHTGWFRINSKSLGMVLSLIATLILMFGCGSPDSQRPNRLFEGKVSIGSLPPDWAIAETNGKGTPAVWQIVADKTAADGAKAVAITKTQNTGQTYNMLIHQNIKLGDVPISVKVKALSGKEDQGGGPVWLYQDNNNYYIARWNPLENNFRVYVVKDGKRKQLGSADVQVDPAAWHTITIDHKGSLIKASLDGRQLIEVKDDNFPDAGKVGVWTKADAATAFDAFHIYYLIL
jgi:hypothetical protein